MDSKYSPLKKPTKCLKNALFRWKRGGQICQKNKPKNLNRKDRKEAEYKSGFFVFLVFLCAAKAIKKAKNFYRKDAKTVKKQNASWIPCLSFLP